MISDPLDLDGSAFGEGCSRPICKSNMSGSLQHVGSFETDICPLLCLSYALLSILTLLRESWFSLVPNKDPCPAIIWVMLIVAPMKHPLSDSQEGTRSKTLTYLTIVVVHRHTATD